jgi:hypothetical protein
METQQAITIALVTVAGVYLVRLGWSSWKAMWSGRAGCGSGCGKCVTAELAERRRPAAAGARGTQIIPLAGLMSSAPANRGPRASTERDDQVQGLSRAKPGDPKSSV